MEPYVVGVDVGALTTKAALLDPSGELIASSYRFHKGNPLLALRDALAEVADGHPLRLVLTGSGARLCPELPAVPVVDTVQATIAAVRRYHPEALNIFDIGGASLTLVRLDATGRFRGYSANSQCAAGTGSFLDEQAMRMGLTYDEIGRLGDVSTPPPVATRCAVFAKSDLIHLQQAGATRAEMWSGLCRGMSQTALQTLLKGKPLGGLTAFVGGVAQNREVLRWLRDLCDSDVITDDVAHLTGAIGAALVGIRDRDLAEPVLWREWLREDEAAAVTVDPMEGKVCGDLCLREEQAEQPRFAAEHADEPLELNRTRYPSFDVEESYVDDEENEVRISRWPDGTKTISGALGIDIGSTSTKLCLIDEAGDVLVDIYRKTAGDPIGATKKLFDALRGVAGARGVELDITGCGTTGSGRKLVGAVVGADAIVNEISAHVAGAMHVDPEIDTIFEIGGQDSKYMRTRNGAIVDANMNYVCAAGTGSFVEEQARKLGIPLHDVGDMVLGLVPPPSSDRCTVFMEQDVNKLLRSGRTAPQALAAVMRSVVQNYLNKVVGNRPYSPVKIAFQGATARNKGLVAAFETLLGVEMVVSPYCHVMGAWGVALLTQAQLRKEERNTEFNGLDLSGRDVTIRKERCDLCDNDCEITYATIQGVDDEPSWGYVCGRDPEDEKMRVLRELDLFKRRDRLLKQSGRIENHTPAKEAPVVVVPRALATWSHFPLWRRLLEELGARVKLTEETGRETREAGAALTAAEFCFPVKVAHGHAMEALTNETFDFVFLPHLIAQPSDGVHTNTFLCPYVQGFPTVVKTALELAGHDVSRIIAPILDRRLAENRQVIALHDALGPALGVSRTQVRDAFRAAQQAQETFEKKLVEAGTKSLKALEANWKSRKDRRPGIVIIGRPYNSNDPGINLDLPRKIAEMGYRVFPLDSLPHNPHAVGEEYENVFWSYGQRILSGLRTIRERDDLFAIYFSNFNCGPDSFLLTYAEQVMGDKPMLALELDEHGADAGYITRIEAFLDVVRGWTPKSETPEPTRVPEMGDLRQRRIWIPPMHPVGSELFAAAFRGDGYDAHALPGEDHRDLDVGQRSTRGCECLPMRTTMGTFLNTTQDDLEAPHALFMPTARGPCRFGQYATLYRQVLDRKGYENTVLLSPSSENAYSGLSDDLRRTLWKVMLTSDLLFKMTLRVRPYEMTVGDADEQAARWIAEAAKVIERQEDTRPLLTEAGRAFSAIPVRDEKKPLVGIVGEIYVRNNPFANEDVIRSVEAAGGEAWMSPISEWILYTAAEDVRKFKELPKTFSETLNHGKRLFKSRFLQAEEAAYFKAAGPLVKDRHEPSMEDTLIAARRYLPFNVGGEAILGLGRAVHFVRQGAALIVNASPFSCMAGTVSAAVFSKLEHELRVPVVNTFYEGSGDENRKLGVFLANLDPSDARSGPPRPRRSRNPLRIIQDFASN